VGATDIPEGATAGYLGERPGKELLPPWDEDDDEQDELN
jgi:hypothetical protein